MELFAALLWVFIVMLIISPSRYDPAIRFKLWTIYKNWKWNQDQ